MAITAEVSASAFDLGSSPNRFDLFSKFDVQQLCNPLTYRSYIPSMERSKPPVRIYHQIKRHAAFL